MDINTNLTGDLSGALDRFSADVREKVLFAGVAAMAKVIYDEARTQAPKSEAGHWFHGTSFKAQTGRKFKDGTPRPDWAGGTKYWFEPGTLKSSIYRVYSPEKSSDSSKLYRISWNHKDAPYGFMVEFGTSRAPAHPFLRPAFNRVHDAIEAGKARMAQKIGEL